MFRHVTLAGLVAAAALIAGGPALGAPATTAPAPATTAPATAAPPAIDSVRLPRTISSQQGHARFLVGVRLATRSKLTIQVIAATGGKVVRTITDSAARPAGRAYVRLEAVDGRGYQLLQGNYRLRMQATDAAGKVSAAVEAPFQLTLTPPHGLFDAYTVPLWRAFTRQAGTTTPGQLVAVVGPKGPAAAAGLRRGDVITSLNGKPVAAPGAWAVALRALPADTAVTVEYLRKGATRTGMIEAGPDWEPAPDFATSLAVAVRRDPRSLAYAVAQARQLIDAGTLDEAATAMSAWPKAWRTSAPGELTQGDLQIKRTRWKQALGAYNRARARDRTMAAAEFGRGVALSSLKKTRPSATAFAAAGRLDPTDPAPPAFQAYALLNLDDDAGALAASQRAVSLDTRYADGFLPYGISLLAAGDRAGGVKMLRRGLVLLEDPDRAASLIAEHLDPTDP